jgi:hypothetical protein
VIFSCNKKTHSLIHVEMKRRMRKATDYDITYRRIVFYHNLLKK